MPKKILSTIIFFLLIFYSYLLIPNSLVFADTPGPTGTTTCDVCGWCNKEVNLTPPANWSECKNCLFEPTSGVLRDRYYYTVLGCFSTDPSGGPFVKQILSIVFGMAGGIAFLSVLWGSAMVLTSSGDPGRLQAGKDTIVSSTIGILLIIFSIFLLRVVGVDILKIPGFGG